MGVKNRLKEVLEKKGIKQSWLAEQCGITKQTMSGICSNKYNTSLEVALKISEVLDEKVDDLFCLEKSSI